MTSAIHPATKLTVVPRLSFQHDIGSEYQITPLRTVRPTAETSSDTEVVETKNRTAVEAMFAKRRLGLLRLRTFVSVVGRSKPLSARKHLVVGKKDMPKLRDLQSVGQAYGRIEHTAQTSTIFANAGTDAFSPPDGTPGKDCLIGLRLPVFGDCWAVSVCVAPVFAASFDAGAFMLRAADASWAKLAFERAPDGRTMAVSVVTRGLSDDANGPAYSQPAIFLRACFTGKALAFHTSSDGRSWDLLRFFALPQRVTSVDLIAQSPVGAGCRVVFSDLQVSDRVPLDLRDGT